MLDKIVLPKKTKIAIWIMKLNGIIFLIYGIMGFLSVAMDISPEVIRVAPLFLIGTVVFFLFAHFLLKNKRWAWQISVALFFFLFIFIGIYITHIYIESLRGLKTCESFAVKYSTPIAECREFYLPSSQEIVFFFSFFIFFIVLPLILLFLDRKNYWKIAS